MDSHTAQEVLDPLSSSLDRAIFNSGAKSQASGSLLSVGLEVNLCEELPLGAEVHHGPAQLHTG